MRVRSITYEGDVGPGWVHVTVDVEDDDSPTSACELAREVVGAIRKELAGEPVKTPNALDEGVKWKPVTSPPIEMPPRGFASLREQAISALGRALTDESTYASPPYAGVDFAAPRREANLLTREQVREALTSSYDAFGRRITAEIRPDEICQCGHRVDQHRVKSGCQDYFEGSQCICARFRPLEPVEPLAEVKENRPGVGRMANLDVEDDPTAIQAQVRAEEGAKKIAQERKTILDRLRNAPLRKPRSNI